MRKLILCAVLITFALGVLPSHASPPKQFAGCAPDQDMPYAARFILSDIADTKFTITVIGLGDFDPQLEIRDSYGVVWGCNDDRPSANGIGVSLPTAVGGFSEKTAQMTVRFYEEEHPDTTPSDFEIIVTGAGHRSGEFALIYQGGAVLGADDLDTFRVFSTEQQAAQGVPLYMYLFNPARPNNLLKPQITFWRGGIKQVCSTSAYSPYCDGDTVPLDGFDVTLEPRTTVALTGEDVMLRHVPELGGEEYQIEVQSYRSETWGDYVLILQSGVAYATEGMQ